MEYKNLTMVFIAILTVITVWLTYDHLEKMKELDLKIMEIEPKTKKAGSVW